MIRLKVLHQCKVITVNNLYSGTGLTRSDFDQFVLTWDVDLLSM